MVYVALEDITEGLSIGDENAGADIDAVGWRCPNGDSGYALSARGGAADPQRAYGPPQDCDEPPACAVSLGLQGFLVFDVGATNLSGCTITVSEVADREEDAFGVWTCPEFAYEGCTRIGRGEDGDTFEVTVP